MKDKDQILNEIDETNEMCSRKATPAKESKKNKLYYVFCVTCCSFLVRFRICDGLVGAVLFEYRAVCCVNVEVSPVCCLAFSSLLVGDIALK